MDPLVLILIIVLVLWLGGWLFIPAAGSLIHVLLVIAVVLLVIRLVQGWGPPK
jgi:hypothetical protein